MLEEIQSRNMDEYSQSGTVSRSGRFQDRQQQRFQSNKQPWKSRANSKKCCLCEAAGRQSDNHYIQACPFLPASDRRYISKARDIFIEDEDSEDELKNQNYDAECAAASLKQPSPDSTSFSRRIQIVPSPMLAV